MERSARQIRKRLREEALIRALVEVLTRGGTLEHRLGEALTLLRRIGRFSGFEISLPSLNGSGGWVTLSSGGHRPADASSPASGSAAEPPRFESDEPLFSVEPQEARGGVPHPVVTLPLMREGTTLGAIKAISGGAESPGPPELQLLRLVGHILSLVLERESAAAAGEDLRELTRSHGELRRDLRRLTGMLMTARVLAEVPTGGDVFEVVLETVEAQLSPDDSTVYLVDGESRSPLPVASRTGRSVTGRAPSRESRERILLHRVLESGRPARSTTDSKGNEHGYYLINPLLRNNRPFGAFCLWRAGVPFSGAEQRLLSILAGLTTDAMAHSAVQQEARALRERLELVERYSREGIIFLDTGGRVVHANREALRLLDARVDEVLGRQLFPRLFQTEKEAQGLIRDLACGGEISNIQTIARAEARRPLAVEVTAATREEDGAGETGTVLFVRQRAAAGVGGGTKDGGSRNDPLTGLLSQVELFPELRTALSRATREKAPLSLILLRLVGLRTLNQQAGHARGDRLLKEFCDLVGEQIRRRVDRACRIGGGELLIILPETAGKRGAEILGRIESAVRPVVRPPLRFQGTVAESRPAESAELLLSRLLLELEKRNRVQGD